MELARNDASPHYLKDAKRLQSARASLALLCKFKDIRRIWIPAYICPAVREAVAWANVEILTYPLQQDFLPPKDLRLSADEWLLIVVYFGLTTAAAHEATSLWPRTRLIFDAAQALYFPAHQEIPTIYSPRKFIGVADGGFLTGNLEGLELPHEIDNQGIARLSAAIGRLEGSPELHYSSFLKAEQSLLDIKPRRMSLITERILQSADWVRIRDARRSNFQTLMENLPDWCQPALSLGHEDVPLCMPVRTSHAALLREFLMGHRVYTPTYWRGLDNDSLNAFERLLCMQTICLPCDQRYGEAEMRHVTTLIHRFQKMYNR